MGNDRYRPGSREIAGADASDRGLGIGAEDRKEITGDEPAAGVGRQPAAKRQQPALMPLDHLGKRIDDHQRLDPRVVDTASAV